MARKATVDRDMALEMLRKGESTHSVAEHFGVSRQAIDLHRREFIKRGLLSDERAFRKTVAREKIDEDRVTGRTAISLDQLIDLVIEAFNSLRRLPELEAELEKYRYNYQKASEHIDVLEKEASKRKEQELRWMLSVEQGEISKPSNEK
jgi:hypothetical protein